MGESKWVLTSWQFWASVAAILYGLAVLVLHYFHPGMFSAEIVGSAPMAILGGLTGLGLRVKTKQPVSMSRPFKRRLP